MRDEAYGQVPEEPPLPQAAGTEYFSLDVGDVLAAGPGFSPNFGGRSASCGTLWSTSSTLCVLLPWCKFSMHFCCRWWNSCQASSGSSTRSNLIPSRLSKCSRSCPRMSLCERLFANRSWRNSWWKCRRILATLLPSLLSKPLGGGQQRR